MLHTQLISYTYFSFKGAFTHIYYVIDSIAVVMGVMVALALVVYPRCVCMCVCEYGRCWDVSLPHVHYCVIFIFPVSGFCFLKESGCL